MRKKCAMLMIAAVTTIAACGSKPDGITISGKISGTKTIALTQVEDINRKKYKLIGRIDVEPDGSFTMGFEQLDPHLYELNFPNGKKTNFVLAGGEKLVFSGDADEAEKISVTGSPDNEILTGYENFRKESLERLVLSVRKQIKDLPEAKGEEFERLGKLEVSNYVKHKEELLDYAVKNMGTSIALYATSSRWPQNIPVVETLVAEFEKSHPDLAVTQRLKEKLVVLKQTSIGGVVADINMRDEEGKQVSLSESKGKYTLIDFWGSWCGPCRREAESLSRDYAKYKPLGFEIFGVGLETDLATWKEAKEADKRIWPNVLSLNEFETDAAYDFAVTALPANFLIDENGKIVARDIHDEELTAKLAELLGR